jgi:hypothetical protein
MVIFSVDIGVKELYTLKSFNFYINNIGSADLKVNSISISSNLTVDFISTPFIIVKDSSYNFSGTIKIVNFDATNLDFVDLFVSYNNGIEDVSDIYRYYINYKTILYNTYTQVITVSNINYIDNMICLYIDSDDLITNFSSIILLSIDDEVVNIFPNIYNISQNKIIYTFKDNVIKNRTVNDSIKFFISTSVKNIELKKLMYRSI